VTQVEPEPDPRRWIGALRRSHDELASFVRGLSTDELGRQSACSEWSVAQVLAHLGSGAESGLATVERALAGQDPPPSAANAAVWDRWNAMPPEEQRAGFVTSDARRVARLEGLDSATLASLRIHLEFLPEPLHVAGLVGMMLAEHALHSWDVFVSFRRAATVPPYAAELLVDGVPLGVPWVGRADAWTGPATTVAVETTNPARRFTLALGETVALTPGGGNTDARLRLPAEALIRLTAGRLNPDTTPPVEVTGSVTLDQLRLVFPGF
jgi:uncharacterized protein (TIGR03083 family)